MKTITVSGECLGSETGWRAAFERFRKPARRVLWRAIAALTVSAALFGTGRLCEAAEKSAAVTASPELSPLDIAVVDESGAPVEGAEVEANGLRTTGADSGSWYSWQGEAQKAPTDVRGVARIQYPKYVLERMETGKVDVLVSHGQFVQSRQDVSVDGSSKPVVLLRGATVRVFGYVEKEGQPAWPIHALIDDRGPQVWVPVGGPRQGLASGRPVQPGPHFLWLVHRSPEGTLLFSEALGFTAERDGVHEFSLPLAPGMRLEGRLDDTIARPVKNGRAELWVHPLQQDSSGLRWTAGTTVNEEGVFVFESVPKGSAEVAAWCDGGLTDHHPEGPASYSVFPLPVDLSASQSGIVIPMTRTARAEVSVEGPDGKPVDGATVGFWPNIQWFRRFATIVVPSPMDSMEMLGTDDAARKEAWASRRSNPFSAVTDAAGRAVIPGLPPGHEQFAVNHDAFEMPIGGTSRHGSIDLKPGETATVTVRLQPKGTQFLTESSPTSLWKMFDWLTRAL
jgi:hypothetical protein